MKRSKHQYKEFIMSSSHVPPEGKRCLNSFWNWLWQIINFLIFCSTKWYNYGIFFCSAEMSAGQIQHENVLHSRRMHLGGSQPVPANPRPVHVGRDEGVPLCPAASGAVHLMLLWKDLNFLIEYNVRWIERQPCFYRWFQEFKPHIFIVAEEAYRNVQGHLEPVDQSLVVSGESGAGKVNQHNLCRNWSDLQTFKSIW